MMPAAGFLILVENFALFHFQDAFALLLLFHTGLLPKLGPSFGAHPGPIPAAPEAPAPPPRVLPAAPPALCQFVPLPAKPPSDDGCGTRLPSPVHPAAPLFSPASGYASLTKRPYFHRIALSYLSRRSRSSRSYRSWSLVEGDAWTCHRRRGQLVGADQELLLLRQAQLLHLLLRQALLLHGLCLQQLLRRRVGSRLPRRLGRVAAVLDHEPVLAQRRHLRHNSDSLRLLLL